MALRIWDYIIQRLRRSNIDEYEEWRRLGKQEGLTDAEVDEIIAALDDVYLAQHELEMATRDDPIKFKFPKNRNFHT